MRNLFLLANTLALLIILNKMTKGTSDCGWCMGVGMSLQLLSGIYFHKPIIFWPIFISGSILLLFYFRQYVADKGYAQWWAALILLGYLGLIILVLLPNRGKHT